MLIVTCAKKEKSPIEGKRIKMNLSSWKLRLIEDAQKEKKIHLN